MKALFTTIGSQRTPNISSRPTLSDVFSESSIVGIFLTNAAHCIRLVFQKGDKASTVFDVKNESVRVENATSSVSFGRKFDYYSSGFSPPPEQIPPLSNQHYQPPYLIPFKPLIMQTMSQLSCSSRSRVQTQSLGARFDEIEKRWLPNLSAKSAGNEDFEAAKGADHEGFMAKSSRSTRVFVSSLIVALFSVFTVFGQIKTIDLSLSQVVSNGLPQIGDPIKYTVFLKNSGPDVATNIVVKDVFPVAGATPGVVTPQAGTNYAGGSWTVPTLAAGDSVKLELNGTVIGEGVSFNIAEIMSNDASQEDIDSNPGNGKLGEDDYATACFSVPILWTPGDEYKISLAAAGYSNLTWFNKGVKITGIAADSATVSGDTLVITGTGRFSFTANANTCPATGCCEIIIKPALLGSIGNFVWVDANDNGQQDLGELGVKDVRVILYIKDGTGAFVKSDSVLTDANGKYLFTGLPAGDYKVQFVASTLPASFQFTGDRKSVV